MAMEDSGMMSPADIAALTRGNTGFGGDGISWLVLILLFFGFMGGGWGGRYNNGELGKYATAASQQDILFGQHFGQINDRLTNIGNGICSLGYDMQGNIAGLEKAGLERQIQEQAAKISALELASQMVGVVKYPMSYAYSAGASPFCGGAGCGAGCYATNV